MPTINMRFWGVFRDGKIHDVCRSMAAAERMRAFRTTPKSKHKWAIALVQVIYN